MAISYNKLWKLLIDKKMTQAELRKAADIAPNTMTKLRRDEPVNLAILGRVLLTPEIFPILENTELGAGGELQLTDAMAKFARTEGIYALEFEGTRFDMGSKTGFLKANITKGLAHPETKDELKLFIKELAKELD